MMVIVSHVIMIDEHTSLGRGGLPPCGDSSVQLLNLDVVSGEEIVMSPKSYHLSISLVSTRP